MRGRRRDLNVGQQSLIRGSNRMTLLRLGLPLSRWRASKAHSTHEGSPALSCPQRRIPRRGLFWVCNLLCWLSVKSWSRRLWRGWSCAGNRPDEAHHFACDSDIDDISGLAARAQSTISGAEPDFRFPPDFANVFWQRLDPVDLVTADARLHSVSPSAFDQRAPGMRVAGLGDAPASGGLTARSFFSQHHGIDQRDSAHRLQGVDNRAQSPFGEEAEYLFLDSLEAPFGIHDGIDIVLKCNLLGGMFEGQSR